MKKLLCVLALGLMTAAPMQASETNLVAKAGDWSIFEHKKDCMTETTMPDGTIVRIGLSDKGKKGYLATYNQGWLEFHKHKKYPLSYDLDGTTFDVEGKGVKRDDVPGAEITFEDPAVLVELAKKKVMTLSVDGVEVTKIDLTGSDEAIKQMLACQDAQK